MSTLKEELLNCIADFKLIKCAQLSYTKQDWIEAENHYTDEIFIDIAIKCNYSCDELDSFLSNAVFNLEECDNVYHIKSIIWLTDGRLVTIGTDNYLFRFVRIHSRPNIPFHLY